MWKRPQLLLAAKWQLIRNAGHVDTGDPTGLCFEEVALLVGLDGEYLSSGHTVLRFDLPQINEIKNVIVNPGFRDFLIEGVLLGWRGCHLLWIHGSCTGDLLVFVPWPIPWAFYHLKSPVYFSLLLPCASIGED